MILFGFLATRTQRMKRSFEAPIEDYIDRSWIHWTKRWVGGTSVTLFKVFFRLLCPLVPAGFVEEREFVISFQSVYIYIYIYVSFFLNMLYPCMLNISIVSYRWMFVHLCHPLPLSGLHIGRLPEKKVPKDGQGTPVLPSRIFQQLHLQFETRAWGGMHLARPEPRSHIPCISLEQNFARSVNQISSYGSSGVTNKLWLFELTKIFCISIFISNAVRPKRLIPLQMFTVSSSLLQLIFWLLRSAWSWSSDATLAFLQYHQWDISEGSLTNVYKCYKSPRSCISMNSYLKVLDPMLQLREVILFAQKHLSQAPQTRSVFNYNNLQSYKSIQSHKVMQES